MATVFNVARVIRYSQSDTELATQASRDEARAADLRAEAARLRASVDPQQIELASAEARQANELIDRRTFSWTELFNRFETTLPDEVRITAVRPTLDEKGGMRARPSTSWRDGRGRRTSSWTTSKATGAFSDLLSVQEQLQR